MMVILWFSCNFEMVVGGDKHNIYLLLHLDQKPILLFLEFLKILFTNASVGPDCSAS